MRRYIFHESFEKKCLMHLSRIPLCWARIKCIQFFFQWQIICLSVSLKDCIKLTIKVIVRFIRKIKFILCLKKYYLSQNLWLFSKPHVLFLKRTLRHAFKELFLSTKKWKGDNFHAILLFILFWKMYCLIQSTILLK